MNQMIRQAAGRRTAGWTPLPIVVSQSKPPWAALILRALLTFDTAEQAKRKHACLCLCAQPEKRGSAGGARGV